MSPKRNAASPRATAGRHSSSPPRPVSLRGGEGSSGVSSGLSRRSLLPAAAIAALVLASYLPALRAGFIWDDDLWVTGSDRLGSLRGLLQIWTSVGRAMQYYPLFHSAIWIEHRFWGTNPAGYHLVNVLLQAANAILLWRLLLRLCVPGAWLATALFAVHPVQAASVAWITEQKNLLSLFFSLLSARFYLRAFPPEEADRTGETDRPKETDPPAPPRRGRLYLASILLFFAALLSKMVACTLPAALLLLIWWKRGRVGTRDVRRLAPFFLAALAIGLATAAIERNQASSTVEQVVPLSLTERLLVAGRAVWFYVGKTLWPHPLIPIYPRWRIEGGWLWTLPATVVVSVVLLWRLRGRIGRGPLAAWLYYLGTLAPALGFLPIAYFYYSFVADHFQYAASPGLFALVGAGLAALGGRAGRLAAAGPVGLRGRVDEVAGGWMGGIAAALILVSLCGLTWRQTRIYHDRWSLWSYTVAENPGCWMAWADLGDVLCEEGRLRDGIEHYERALAARPDDVETLFRRGVAFGKLADFERAAGDFSRVLQLSPNNVKALYNRGVAYAALLRREEALSDFSAAAARNPNDPVIRNARGEVLMEMGRWADALRDFEQALRLAPGYNTARQNLARVEGKVSGGR